MSDIIQYNIFDTKDDADQAQAYDFSLFIQERACDNEYCEITKCWDIPRQTQDGRWAYLACPDSDAVYETIVFTENLFPQEEQ
jgi:hypothetical protein